MKPKIYNLITAVLVLMYGLDAKAQCSVLVPRYASGGNVVQAPIADSYVQTFKPTCPGVLGTIVFPIIYTYADDFRGSGYFVTCRIKDAAGNVLGTAPRTDNWYPGATVTFDFACTGVALVSGTTYQFQLTDGDANGVPLGGGGVYLLQRSSTASVYPDGFCTLDATQSPNADLYGWTVNVATGVITTSASSVTQALSPCGGFYNAANQMLTSILPGATNGISGSTTAKVWIESAQPAQYVKRHYEITPAANAATATGRVTLYFTQSEFDAFNAVNTTKLPANGTDATGIANLRIEKRPGTSSDGTGLPGTYTANPITIDPADAAIVYNGTASRWEVGFDVTGFSGFFVKTLTAVLPVSWLSISGNLNNRKQAMLGWQVQETNVSTYSIERSNDGMSFGSIGTMGSKGDGLNNYGFTEAEALQGTAFYRIRQTDRDGKFGYSSIVRLADRQPGNVSVYPNPVKDVLTMSGATVGTRALLTDMGGRPLQQFTTNGSTFTISMHGYASGSYLLKTGDGRVLKVIKQ